VFKIVILLKREGSWHFFNAVGLHNIHQYFLVYVLVHSSIDSMQRTNTATSEYFRNHHVITLVLDRFYRVLWIYFLVFWNLYLNIWPHKLNFDSSLQSTFFQNASSFRKCCLAKLKQRLLFFDTCGFFLCSAPTYPKFGKPMPNHSILHLISQLGWYGFFNLGFGQKMIVFTCPTSCLFLDFRDFTGRFFFLANNRMTHCSDNP